MIQPGGCTVSNCEWSPQTRQPFPAEEVGPGALDVFEDDPWPALDLMPGPLNRPWSTPCSPIGPSGQPPVPEVPPQTAAPSQPAAQVRPALAKKPARALGVVPQRQPNSYACGQTSVAMTLGYLTGKPWTASQVASKYGYGLREALQRETSNLGLTWKDRDFSPRLWGTIEEKLKLGRPVIMGLNGPEFSPSGRGHIVTLTGIQGNTVTFLDPATGEQRKLPRSAFEKAPPHPDGKFVFYAVKSH